MMAPTLAFDADGLALAIGAAGGTRLRTALVQGVLAADPRRGLDAASRSSGRGFHPIGSVVHAEPGVAEARSGLERGRVRRSALAGPAPLLRRRQRDWAERPAVTLVGAGRRADGLTGMCSVSQPT